MPASTSNTAERGYSYALIWLALSRARRGASAGGGNVFVFRPQGPADASNVFLDWPDLMTAVGQAQGPKWIEIDGSPPHTHVPAGTWDLDGCTISSTSGGDTVLAFEEGATITLQSLTVSNVILRAEGTAPVWVPTVASLPTIAIVFGGLIDGLTAPFLEVQSGITVGIVCELGTLSNAGNPAVKCDTGGNCLIEMLGYSELDGDALGGATSSTVYFDDTFINGGAQLTTPDFVSISYSTQVNYTPGASTYWNPQPATVAEGLDQLAAYNFGNAQNGTELMGTTVTFSAPAITQAKSGLVMLSAMLSGTDSEEETISVQLVRDATNIGSPITVPTSSLDSNPWQGTICWTDILPAGAHTYRVKATGNFGGTLTIAPEGAAILVVEQ